MKLYEFQAKLVFKKFGIPCPKEILVDSIKEGMEKIEEINFPCVLKAQVLIGRRGETGGIKIVEREEDFSKKLQEIFSSKIKDLPVSKILISEKIGIEKELYLSITVSRELERPVVIASDCGGIEVEKIAAERPSRIFKEKIDPFLGLLPYQSRKVSFSLFRESDLVKNFSAILSSLVKIFFEYEALLVEINPLALTRDRNFIALDAKIILDDDAFFRHKDWEKYLTNEDSLERNARKEGFSFVNLGGKIGCIANGAGLTLATLDLIKQNGGKAANFLDLAGSSSPEKTKRALEIVLRNGSKLILVNIFGGITRCDDIAQGIINFLKEENSHIPIICRLMGTNQDKAKQMLQGTPAIVIDTMEKAIKMACEKLR